MKHHQLTEAQACAFHQLTKVEIIVWCYLKASDPFGANPIPGPAKIARATSLHKGNVSKALKSLETKGWSVAAGQPAVAVEQPSVAIGQQSVAEQQPNVAVEQPNVAAGQLSKPETRSVTESQNSLDLEDLKIEDQERRERDAIANAEEIGPDSPAPILQAIAQVQSGKMQPEHGLTTAKPRRSPRVGVTTSGEGNIPPGDWPKVRDFAMAKAKQLPKPPAAPFAVAMKWLREDPDALYSEYKSTQAPPSHAETVLARAVGTAAEPWPELPTAPKPEPTPADHAARLAAKWRSMPAQRNAIASECQRLGIQCTDLGPTIPATA